MSDALALARRFMDAVEAGDIEAARACFQPDAGIWHNYDGKTQSVDENLALLGWMAKRCRARRYQIRRLEAVEGGYLQQHSLVLELNDGKTVSTEAIALVSVRDGRIARIEEYLDPGPIGAIAQQ
ncbi:MAG: nuclear transport factor 2 family protein [Myxococcota bacterium]